MLSASLVTKGSFALGSGRRTKASKRLLTLQKSKRPAIPIWNPESLKRKIASTYFIVDTMSKETLISDAPMRRTRRSYSAQFKAQLVAACQQPGASVAALAREHGMNANLLHRWRREHEPRVEICASGADAANALPGESCARSALTLPAVSPVVSDRSPARSSMAVVRSVPAFLPVDLQRSAPAESVNSTVPADIRIECCHHGTQVTVHWPVAAASECRHWLQSLLRGTAA